jgi:hypothetical protein
MGAPQSRSHAIGRAGRHPHGYARAHAHAEPHSHAAAHEPFAHAVPHQPVTIPRGVRAEPVTIGGIVGTRWPDIR